jgi:hypothetical protein
MPAVPTVGCHTATHRKFSLDPIRSIEPLAQVARPSSDAPNASLRPGIDPTPHEPGRPFLFAERDECHDEVLRQQISKRDRVAQARDAGNSVLPVMGRSEHTPISVAE